MASTGDFVRTADVFTHQRFRMDSDLLVLRGKHGGEAAGTYRPTASPYDRAMMCGAIKDGHGKVIGVARVLGKQHARAQSVEQSSSSGSIGASGAHGVDGFEFDRASEVRLQSLCNLLVNAIVGAAAKADEAKRMYKIGKIVQSLEPPRR